MINKKKPEVPSITPLLTRPGVDEFQEAYEDNEAARARHEDKQKSEREIRLQDIHKKFALIRAGDERTYQYLRERISLYAPRMHRDAQPTLDALEKLWNERGNIPQGAFLGKLSTHVLSDYIEFYLNNPATVEEIDREILMNREGNYPLSKLLYYNFGDSGKDKSHLRIHIAPGRSFTNEEVMDSIIEGFAKLTDVVRTNPDITTIIATSWLVAAYQKNFTHNKFVIEPITPEEIKAEFPDETRPVMRAVIDREKFLEVMTRRGL